MSVREGGEGAMTAEHFRNTCVLWFSLAIVVLVFLVDIHLPLGVASGVPYLFAVLFAMSVRPRWAGPAIAIVCMGLTLLKMEIHSERGTTEWWKVIANRGLALVAIGIVAFVGWMRQRAELARQAAESDALDKREELARLARVRTLGEAAAWLAHELNQPLAAISLQVDLATEMARQGPTRLTELSSFLNQAATQAARASEIVRSLRLLAGGPRMLQDAVDLNRIVEDTVRLMRPHADRAGVELQVLLQRPAAAILGDRVQLQQVLVNLIQNGMDAAVQGSAPEKKVCISTQVRADHLEIQVCDTGGGFVNLERAFERFHTTKSQGLGLGLAICKEIIDAHGGKIEAKPGERPFGARLLVQLPIPLAEAL